uniref:Ribosomal protein S13 n=1 Tax=Ahnfeltia plicata TaxID=28023 RepID=A0A1C9CBA4_9FLOR|nr:ribosomal protein S13 [Ahnfeltia plicata]YP_010204095.1 ribosomal protein S13 [Ahnfeltia fastigiata]AOM65671.1 ribosomal protein S13 [Ahnfeltia plicata]UAT97237.1 ribosomal protein S13 [Ahnfeltia plicata]UAT97442.1 ribosomal protein S13 [Ahnfeltia plicata]UAT97646.1 ribosomal protein S13 [Ahnfeltia fastigiata]
MARIAGVDLPRNKRIEVALTYIYGIGLSRSQKILKTIHIDPNLRIINLSDEQIVALRNVLNTEYQIEGDLRRLESMNIKRLMEISSYRGKRHRTGLPLRGQRTRTNARTRRGGKKTMAGKKKAPRK